MSCVQTNPESWGRWRGLDSARVAVAFRGADLEGWNLEPVGDSVEGSLAIPAGVRTNKGIQPCQ